jgi:hypothetical protein
VHLSIGEVGDRIFTAGCSQVALRIEVTFHVTVHRREARVRPDIKLSLVDKKRPGDVFLQNA